MFAGGWKNNNIKGKKSEISMYEREDASCISNLVMSEWFVDDMLSCTTKVKKKPVPLELSDVPKVWHSTSF